MLSNSINLTPCEDSLRHVSEKRLETSSEESSNV